MTIQTLHDHEERLMPLFKGDYRYGSLAKLAQRYVVGPRVLDMRCTTGELSVELATKGYRITALDGHHKGAALTNGLARRRGIPRKIASAWEFTGLLNHVEEGTFDTAICIDVLSHAEDDQEMMADTARALKDGGRLILVAPAFPGLHGVRDEVFGHVRRYTRSGLRALLERNGFEIELLRFWNFAALPAYVVLERVLKTQVPETIRWPQEGLVGSTPLNRMLRWWYTKVENKLCFPIGLSHFAVARARRPSP